jgi:hypothetical protein
MTCALRCRNKLQLSDAPEPYKGPDTSAFEELHGMTSHYVRLQALHGTAASTRHDVGFWPTSDELGADQLEVE